MLDSSLCLSDVVVEDDGDHKIKVVLERTEELLK